MKRILFFLFLFTSFSSFCQKIILSDKQIQQDISSLTSIFEDETNNMPFEEIQKQSFKKNNNKVIIFPFSDHTFWVKFTIENQISNEKEFALRWVNSLVEHLDFYIPQADGTYKIFKDGGLVYKEKNKFTENLPDVHFEVFDNKEHTYFIKIKSQRGHSGILEIFTKSSYIEEKYNKFKREGLFNGFFLLRLFYVLLLAFFIIKDKTFQRYSFLIIVRSGAYWGIMGILGATFTKNPVVGQYINFSFYYLVPVAYLMVVKSVLEFDRFPKIVHYIYRTLISLTLIFCALILLNYHWYWLKASTYMIVLSIFYSLILLIVSVIKKYKVDWAYTIPILLGMLSNLYLPMRLIGMPDFPGTFAISTICFVLEIFIFGLFLGKIIRNYENNKVKNENELLFNKEQAANLKELDALKTNFFTNISHEFRTPLTLILSPLEDLRKEFPKNEVYQIMYRNAKRLLTLINQLLDLSKLEAKQMQPEFEKVELVRFFRTLTSAFSSLAESREIHFEIQQDKEEVWGFIDKDKIETILTNILSNAFKFTEKGQKVNVNISYQPNNFTIEIQDYGIGIPKEKLPKIFDRFYQIDDTKNQGYEGTGIGLSLVKELAEVLKGEISVESRVNYGTTFTVKLPTPFAPRGGTKTEYGMIDDLEEKTETFANNTPKAIINSTTAPVFGDEGAFLLIVDDNADIRTYIRSIFEKEYQIIEATDGEDGLEKAIIQVPDVIISDLMMPKMDGFEFCKQIKTNEKTSHIPVIMLTAKATIESRIEGFELQADDYLTKPFNTDEIKARVKNVVMVREKLKKYFGQKVVDLKPSEIKVNSIEEIFIQKTKSAIEKNIANNQFDVEQFADEMNISSVQLRRKIKALTNQTVIEFIRTYRLQKAANLLSQKAGTVSEIAYQVGFESLSYFSKLFQEQFGVLPSEYRSPT